MKILYQTSLTEPDEIWSNEGATVPKDPNSLSARLTRFLHPVVQVQQNDMVLYKTGEWYEPYPTGRILVGTLVTIGLLAGALAIAVRRKK